MATELQKLRLINHAKRARMELEEAYRECEAVPEDTSDVQNSCTETLTYLENVELYASQIPITPL